MSIEVSASEESITRLQLAATTDTYDENQQPVTSEIRQLQVRIVTVVQLDCPNIRFLLPK